MKKEYIIIGILLTIIVIGLFIKIGNSTPVERSGDVVKIDTITIRVPFEKIKEKVVTQEVIVERYKIQYEHEKEQAYNVDDSTAIELFYQLASGN